MCLRWRTGSILNLFVLIISGIFISINLFESKLVVRTLQYNNAQSLYLEYHTDVVVFLIFTQILTHQRWKFKILLVLFLLLWITLFVLAIFAMRDLALLEYPDDDAVYKVLIIEHANGKDPFFNVHPMLKCCGYRNFTDWRLKVYGKYRGHLSRHREFPKLDHDAPVCPDVPPSCCRYQFYCGQHLFSDYEITDSAHITSPGNPSSSSWVSCTTSAAAGTSNDDECPSLNEKIFLRPCAELVKKYTLGVHLLLQTLMAASIAMHICVGLTYLYYYFEEEIQGKPSRA